MKLRKDKNLAEGEQTGHYHRCTGDVEVFGDGIDRLLSAPEGTTVTHEEHKTIEIDPGQWEISIQKEVDPDTDEIRSVID